MPTGFTATKVFVTEKNGVLVTALAAPSTEEDDFYLMLQYKDLHDELDVRFGMDKPYIEYCGQGWSRYGRIERFDLFRDRVIVEMDSSAALHMKNDGILEVRFELQQPAFVELKQAIERTFRNVSYFVAMV